MGVPTNDTVKNRATLKRSSNVDHHWSNEEPDWNKAASLSAIDSARLGWQVGT